METELTILVWPEKVLATPVCTFQNLTVLSSLPDTSDFPPDEKMREVISSMCVRELPPPTPRGAYLPQRPEHVHTRGNN